MSVTVTFRGTSYTIPSPGDANDWGAALNTFLSAVAAASAAVKQTLTGSADVAPLRLTPSAQPTGPNVIGDLYMTTAGVVKVCTVAGTPGTFVSVGTQS